MAAAASAGAQMPDPTQGRSEWEPTDLEIARLPAYCRATLRPKVYPGPDVDAYGCGVWMNHLCPGLTALNRAGNPLLSAKAKQGALRAAEDHIRYTLKHMPANCRLAPEVRLAEQRAKILRMTVK
jgi:hypothetical protein